MAKRKPATASRSESPTLGHPDLDQTIVRIISNEGDATFGTILTGTRDRFSVSRETVARRLARMLRFSRIVRLRHGHYSIGSASTPPSMILRMRNLSVTEVISPDGSAQYQVEKEFLVLSGRCDHMISEIAPAARIRARGLDVAGTRRVRMTTYNERGGTFLVARIIPPIPPGPWIPHRLLVSFQLGPRFYIMQRAFDDSGLPAPERVPRNRHSIGILSNPELGTIVEASKETTIDMRVHFPRGFPRGAIHPKVEAIVSGESLIAEARALVELSKKSGGAMGLTVHGDLVTLRVKNPRIDCFYGFTWVPPSAGAYAKWGKALFMIDRE